MLEKLLIQLFEKLEKERDNDNKQKMEIQFTLLKRCLKKNLENQIILALEH